AGSFPSDSIFEERQKETTDSGDGYLEQEIMTGGQGKTSTAHQPKNLRESKAESRQPGKEQPSLQP
ncbi:MAG: hypothetical protein VX496_08330, partial [Planctomycetota bacterium]|nr:hypothetical protein [Planctomycetota bacterium]